MLLHYQLYCSCSIPFPSVHTSCFISFPSTHFIIHVLFYFIPVHSPSNQFNLPQSMSFTFTMFVYTHMTLSFNLVVSFTFQLTPSPEIKGYLLYKTLLSQNVSSEALRIYFLEKFCFVLKIFKFLYFHIPMIYQICDIMMSIQ